MRTVNYINYKYLNMNLREKYQKEIIPKMMKNLQRKNLHALPRLTKIVINCGLKEALENQKALAIVSNDLASITGQKSTVTTAKVSIATFKLRAGDKIGLKVTLRGKRMYDFLEKLIAIVLPRVRDFHGIKNSSFDKKGNYTLGISDYTVFPEIDAGKIDKIRGLEITLNTTAKNQNEAQLLLKELGFPFSKN